MRQLVWHIAASLGFTADAVRRAKTGKRFDPPAFLTNPVNTFLTRFGARRATRASCAALYAASYAKLLAALDGVTDADWRKGARFFGEFVTVEGQFDAVRRHFEEHRADIEAVR